jgi:hypothetical protein
MVEHPTRRFETECRRHIPRAVGDICAVDICGPLPSGCGDIHYIFVCLYLFTKIFKLCALRTATTKTCLQKTTLHYIANVTRPTCVLKENATQFTSPVRKKRLADVGTEVKFSPMRSPQATAIERCRN